MAQTKTKTAEKSAPPADQASSASLSIPAAIKDMLGHVAQGSTRYAIDGVSVKYTVAGKIELAATNGRALAMITCPATDAPNGMMPFEVVIPAQAIKALKIGAREQSIRLTNEGDGIWSLATVAGKPPATPLRYRGARKPNPEPSIWMAIRFRAITMPFPPYKDVIPAHDEGREIASTIAFSPSLLRAGFDFLTKVEARIAASGMSSSTPVIWRHGPSNRPVRLDWPTADCHALVVAMPMAVESKQ